MNSLARQPGLYHGGGFTYVELIAALAIGALILLGISGVLGQALQTQDAVTERNKLTRDVRFALQHMLKSVSYSRKLLVPHRDKAGTNWPENIREQTVPPSPPIGDSTLATAVLAVTLPAYVDLDGNAIADADNDGDGLIDEDLPDDNHYDFGTGIYLIDDGGNGQVDEGSSDNDNDETNSVVAEDPINGIDDDTDNNVDEDPPADMNADGCPGFCGVDDDGDGVIDEGSVDDDDEDGIADEDWYDPLVYYLDGGQLKVRNPVPWDETGVSGITGRDYLISAIAENVTRFRVERLDDGSAVEVIEITLELTSPLTGESVSLQSRVRLGGAL